LKFEIADLRCAGWSDLKFEIADLRWAGWSDLKFEIADLRWAGWGGLKFEIADLRWAGWSGLKFEIADFRLQSADYRITKLKLLGEITDIIMSGQNIAFISDITIYNLQFIIYHYRITWPRSRHTANWKDTPSGEWVGRPVCPGQTGR
jgi:uncharacterized protein YjbI with pentapeptide repeats